MKATFCLRDVSRVVGFTREAPDASFLICGKEKQGVSPGWGDTYFADFPGQRIGVEGLTSGIYRLTFTLNPSGLLKEADYSNNISSTLFYLDTENKSIRVVSETPTHSPQVEHIYLKQPFGEVLP
jgi:hypothetical protein